jgi:hypothetical protein
MSSTALDDYYVDFLSEDRIAASALEWRKAARNENYARFNIVRFVEDVLSKQTRRPFKIEFFDAAEGEKPGYVTFNPRILHIDRETWRLADFGDPEARLIVAHEVGHLILHDHHAKAFSSDPALRIKFGEPEHSAEWQATAFAYHLLLPSHIVSSFKGSARELAASSDVSEQLAADRQNWVRETTRFVRLREAEICLEAAISLELLMENA